MRRVWRAVWKGRDALHIEPSLAFSDHDAPDARCAAQPGESVGSGGGDQERVARLKCGRHGAFGNNRAPDAARGHHHDLLATSLVALRLGGGEGLRERFGCSNQLCGGCGINVLLIL